ncbi:hypothetical protein BT67DRAFT_435012 [Trichocladium antarcticum]|uniref:Uncharacterized protein n=1 Tax=Trichocladium antarcticum TaxID=1450529 RepID=A0AAN6ZBN0_9PEZI|nr:hypothetical protein BT67DRAFT_435012 [Trichocladium antarcticum]
MSRSPAFPNRSACGERTNRRGGIADPGYFWCRSALVSGRSCERPARWDLTIWLGQPAKVVPARARLPSLPLTPIRSYSNDIARIEILVARKEVVFVLSTLSIAY